MSSPLISAASSLDQTGRSAALSFALLARGFRSISASDGTDRPLRPNGDRARRLQRAERVLHHAILERVERQHHQPSSRRQPRRRSHEKTVQPLQFLVDPDSDRLERSRRRIDARVPLARNGPPHDVSQLPRRLDAAALSCLDNRPRHAPRVTLFTQLVDHVRQCLLVDRCQHLGRGRATRSCPCACRAARRAGS